MGRVYNFSAGPAVLPEEVLKEAADEMLDYQGSGMSVMEMSHRSKVYDNIIKTAEKDLRELMNIPDNYKVLFLQGGASQQFAMIPMNLMKNGVADYIVTGHYARVEYDEEKNRYLLKKAVDDTKDQSYVLYMLTQEQLAHISLPLGGLRKTEVREIAEKHGFVNARKHDSQDICFVPDGDYAKFIEQYTGRKSIPGDFVDTEGNILGKHKGIIHYTLGQRRGLGIPAASRLYVCDISPKTNQVVLGNNEDLFHSELTATKVNLISCESLKEPMRLKAKIRYRHPEQEAVAWQTEDGVLHVRFDKPQRAITRGQAVVLYDGDIVVGGGVIENCIK